MATKKSSGTGKTVKRINSNSKEAKNIIRAEIRAYYSPKRMGEGKSSLDNMRRAAKSASSNLTKMEKTSDYRMGANLVDRGGLACYYSDQDKMLGKIYGKDNVANWSGDKTHEIYKHLIGREYERMCREEEKKAAKPPAKKPAPKKK